MPAETLIAEYETAREQPEVVYGPEEICAAFRDITNIQRHAVAAVLGNIRPHDLTSGRLPKITNGETADDLLRKIDFVAGSDQMRNHIELCIQNGNYPDILKDEAPRSYLIGLARSGFVGSLIDGLLKNGNFPANHRRVYRERLIDMNHSFRSLIENEIDSKQKVTRHDFKKLIWAAYGAGHDEESTKLANSLEAGLSVEVATKRYLQEAGAEFGISVRYSTAQEDSRKIDLVCSQGSKTLGIDVKSGDKNSGDEGELRAKYSPIEELNLSDYRIRELYPAKHTAVGNDFTIKAGRYTEVINELLAEFNSLK